MAMRTVNELVNIRDNSTRKKRADANVWSTTGEADSEYSSVMMHVQPCNRQLEPVFQQYGAGCPMSGATRLRTSTKSH